MAEVKAFTASYHTQLPSCPRLCPVLTTFLDRTFHLRSSVLPFFGPDPPAFTTSLSRLRLGFIHSLP